MVLARREASKDAELLVLRHENAVLRLYRFKTGCRRCEPRLAWRAGLGQPPRPRPASTNPRTPAATQPARAPGKADCLLWPAIRRRLNPSPPLRGRSRCFLGRPADDKSAASCSSVEEMNTRARWSGVKITSVSAITSPAQPQPRRHEDHLRQAEAGEAEPDPRPQDRTVTSWSSSPARGWPASKATPAPRPEPRAQTRRRRRLVSHAPAQTSRFRAPLSAQHWAAVGVQSGGCARLAPGRDQLHSVIRSVSSMRSWCAPVSIVYGIRGRAGNKSPTARNRHGLARASLPGRPRNVTVGDGLVGAASGRVTPSMNVY
jgi:hypothetical protein